LLVQVSLSLNIFNDLTYRYHGDESSLKCGQRVVVPVGNRISTGWIIGKQSDYKGRVKEIIGPIEGQIVENRHFLDFIRSVASIYLSSLGMVLDNVLPPGKKSLKGLYINVAGKDVKLEKFNFKELQSLKKTQLLHFYYKGESQINILSGKITDGSTVQSRYIIGPGRIEEYVSAVNSTLAFGKSVLILVPDLLSARYFGRVFPDSDIYFSDSGVKKRKQIWDQYSSGKVGVVIGGLSAAFLPIQNLGLIICDRAGSALYRLHSFSTFFTPLLAKLRASHCLTPIINGYSTYTTQLYKDRSILPIEDDREAGSNRIEVKKLIRADKKIPDSLIELVKTEFMANRRVLIIVNKMAANQFLYCPKCKKMVSCPKCRSRFSIVETGSVSCVYCHYQEEMRCCRKCLSQLTIVDDIAGESLKRRFQKEISESGILQLPAKELKNIESTMQNIKENRIVIATISIINLFFKDHFDSLIFVSPESIFNMNDYQTAETIFSVLAEINELAAKGGRITIFSTFFFHYSMQFINQEDQFFNREIKYRKWFLIPPYANVYHIEVRGKERRKLAAEMRKIYQTHKKKLNIKQIYLKQFEKRYRYHKGILVVHTDSDSIIKSGLLAKSTVSIELRLI